MVERAGQERIAAQKAEQQRVTAALHAPAAEGRELTFTVEAGQLVPEEFEFSVFASSLQDIVGDLEEIFELRDVRFMVYAPDFEEWCVPGDMDDIGDVARLRITGGSPASSVVASSP